MHVTTQKIAFAVILALELEPSYACSQKFEACIASAHGSTGIGNTYTAGVWLSLSKVQRYSFSAGST
jgi:hypothetical protein